MSDETADLEASFAALFDNAATPDKKKLFNFFLVGFLNRYRLIKRTMSIERFNEPGTPHFFQFFGDRCNEIISYIEKSKELSEKDRATLLGTALGLYIGLVEFMLASLKFSEWSRSEFIRMDGFIEDSQMVKSKLNQAGIKINPKFIKKRIESIAQRHGKEFTPKQRDLLIKLAVIFSK